MKISSIFVAFLENTNFTRSARYDTFGVPGCTKVQIFWAGNTTLKNPPLCFWVTFKKRWDFFFIFCNLLTISEFYSPHVRFGWIVNNVSNDFIGWIRNKVARLAARWQHTTKMMMKVFFSQQIIVWYIHSPHVSFDWIVNNAPHFQSYTMLSYVV